MSKNLFAWASISEKGSVNGNPGNQTGRELRVGDYYDFGQNMCIRMRSVSKRKKMAKIAKWLALCENIGYGQTDRGTLYSLCSGCGWNFKKVKKKLEQKKVNTDCSGLAAVAVNLSYGKAIWGCDTHTGNMVSRANHHSKKFNVLPIAQAEKAFKKGDMPIKAYKHVIINV